AMLVLLGSLRVREEEIPRIALLTAAFLVAAQLRVLIGPTSVHLLLNGLLGVILGRRAAIAVLVGLFFQVALFRHGGFLTIGINTCVMALPALLAGAAFSFWRPAPTATAPRAREFILGVALGAGSVV